MSFVDLNSLFDWNVKQLFLYLVAEYVTPANVRSMNLIETKSSIFDFRVLIKSFYGIK
jgi:hypothetical protein